MKSVCEQRDVFVNDGKTKKKKRKEPGFVFLVNAGIAV